MRTSRSRTARFFFEAPLGGSVRGAVFVGRGHFRADPAVDAFKMEGMRERTGLKSIDTDFKTAVLRFTDDTYRQLGSAPSPARAPSSISKLAHMLAARLDAETG